VASSYNINEAAIVKRLGFQRVVELTNDTAGATTIDSAVLDEAIAAAEAEFHLYAGVYYVVPVRDGSNNIPPGIREKLIELVAWRLMNRRPHMLAGDDNSERKLWSGVRSSIDAWFNAISTADPKSRKPIPGALAISIEGDAARGGGVLVDAEESQFGAGFMRKG
jgi:phage gp36-like protein